jgi:Tat protein secretion system quality control protein TatD with DNase activity
MEAQTTKAESDDIPQTSKMLWDIGVFDAHCHPTDQMRSIDDIPNMNARVLTIMATRAEDQELVAQVAERYGAGSLQDALGGRSNTKCNVVPSFGWHPWFSHQLYDDIEQAGVEKTTLNKIEHYKSVLSPEPKEDEFLQSLPDPRPLSQYLEQTELYLKRFPLALVGEIGLDRAFRIPKVWTEEEYRNRDVTATPGSREGRALSPYHVSMSHQKKILKAQLRLAGKLRRPVSIHSVQAHGAVFEALEQLWAGHEKEVVSNRQRKRRGSVPGAHDAEDDASDDGPQPENTSAPNPPLPFPPRICLHSYSGPPEPLQQFLRASIPSDVFFSFSSCINFSNPSTDKVVQVIKALHEDRLLVESDLHCAGEQMDVLLEDVVRRICDIRGWPLEKGLQIFKKNWQRFVFG